MDNRAIKDLKARIQPGDKLWVFVGSDYINYDWDVKHMPYSNLAILIRKDTQRKEIVKFSDITGWGYR